MDYSGDTLKISLHLHPRSLSWLLAVSFLPQRKTKDILPTARRKRPDLMLANLGPSCSVLWHIWIFLNFVFCSCFLKQENQLIRCNLPPSITKDDADIFLLNLDLLPTCSGLSGPGWSSAQNQSHEGPLSGSSMISSQEPSLTPQSSTLLSWSLFYTQF